ncbi:MAG: IS110 family transposase [Candidatus Limnocylindrales bacterium]
MSVSRVVLFTCSSSECHEGGPSVVRTWVLDGTTHQEAHCILYAGLDLSRQRRDVYLLDEDGRTVEVTAVRPDGDALRTLVARIDRHGQPVCAAIESMNSARFVDDQLELYGWDVETADALRVMGLAPLAAKTDNIDAWVLAELARRELVPAIWLPDSTNRAERERARFRLHLVRHRTALKNRIHATLITFGHPVPVRGHEPPLRRRTRRRDRRLRALGRDLGEGCRVQEWVRGTARLERVNDRYGELVRPPRSGPGPHQPRQARRGPGRARTSPGKPAASKLA